MAMVRFPARGVFSACLNRLWDHTKYLYNWHWRKGFFLEDKVAECCEAKHSRGKTVAREAHTALLNRYCGLGEKC
jgi:hypothetical protein